MEATPREVVRADIGPDHTSSVERRTVFSLGQDPGMDFDVAPDDPSPMVRSEPEFVLVFNWLALVG